jgi:MYXO-CTERM domain-containing protein
VRLRRSGRGDRRRERGDARGGGDRGGARAATTTTSAGVGASPAAPRCYDLRMRSAIFGLILVAAALHAPDASACSIPAPSELVVDTAEQAVDHAAPATVATVGVAVQRGRAPKSEGCGSMAASSCDDLGIVTLTPTAPADDRTDASALGYRVRLVAGALPDGSSLWPKAVVPGVGGGLALVWIDGADDEQEPVDFTVTVAAVDRAGNEGPASAPVRVTDGGSSGGCRTRGAGDAASAGLVAMVVLAAGALARRRRQRG